MAYANPIKMGIRQAKRWILAAQTDERASIKMLHANYAVGVMDSLRQMYSDQQIRSVTGADALKLLQQSANLQDQAQKLVLSICPRLK